LRWLRKVKLVSEAEEPKEVAASSSSPGSKKRSLEGDSNEDEAPQKKSRSDVEEEASL
jgi:hypothetical protein